MNTLTRRNAVFAMTGAAWLGSRAQAADDPWLRLPAILKGIQPPTFPAREFAITRFGAKEGGKVDNTEAFRKAIDEAARAGGGRVTVPEGVFLTGAIHLKSNVNLVVPKGATIKFNPDRKLPGRERRRLDAFEDGG